MTLREMARILFLILAILSLIKAGEVTFDTLFDWSKIKTAKELSGVNPEEFISITRFDVEMLTVNNTEICTGFTAEQIRHVKADAFTGFQSSCVGLWNPSVFQDITGSQAEELNFAQCGRINGTQIEKLSAEAWAGLLTDCVAGFSDELCESLAPYELQLLRGSTFSGFSVNCFSHSVFNILSEIDQVHFGVLYPRICSVFSADTIRSIIPATYRGMTWSCMEHMPPMACEGFDAERFSHMLRLSVSGITPACFLSMSLDTFDKAGVEQVFGFIEDICKVLTPGHLRHLPAESFKGFQAMCASVWNPNVCTVLDQDLFGYLDVEVIQVLTALCTARLPHTFFHGATAKQIEVFNNATCKSFETNTPIFSEPDYVKFYAFTPQCVKEFGKRTCGTMTPSSFGNLTAPAYGSLSPDCVNAMNSDSFSLSTPEQIEYLLPDTCASLPPKTLQYLPAASYKGFKMDCISQWTKQMCYYIDGKGLNNVQMAYFGSFKSPCLATISPNAIAQLKPLLAPEFPVDWLMNLSSDQLKAIPPAFMSNLTPTQASGLYFNCDVLSMAQIGSFTHLSKVPTACWEDIQPLSLEAVTKEILEYLPKRICEVISMQQMKYLTIGGLNYLSDECIQSLSSKAIQGFGNDALKVTFSQKCQLFSSDQFSQISKFVIANIGVECAMGLTRDVCESLRIDQLSEFPDSAFHGLTGDCIGSFSSQQLRSLKMGQVSSLLPAPFALFCTNTMPLLYYLQQFPDLPSVVTKLQTSSLNHMPECFDKINDLFMNGQLKGDMDYGFSTNVLNTLFVYDDGFKDLSATTIGLIESYKVEGIRQSHAVHFSVEQLAALPSYFFSFMQPSFLLGIEGHKIEAIEPKSIGDLKDKFSYIRVDTIPNLTKAQIQFIQPTFSICVEQAKAFTNVQKHFMSSEVREAITKIINENKFFCPHQKASHSSSSASSTSSTSGSSTSSGSGLELSHSITKIFAGVLILLLLFATMIIGINHCKMVKEERKNECGNNLLNLGSGNLGTMSLLPSEHSQRESLYSKHSINDAMSVSNLSGGSSPSVRTYDITADSYIPLNNEQISRQTFNFLLNEQNHRQHHHQNQQFHHRQVHLQRDLSMGKDGRLRVPPRLPSMSSVISDSTVATGQQSHPLFSKVRVGKMSQLSSVIAAGEDESDGENESWR